MSTTTTTTMQSAPPNPRPPKRTPVPLLLESFPTPPSHIPPTPTTPLSSLASTPSHNPPPSGPPTTPLPPVPGPSRISEHEQLLLLSSAVNRSRRSSKYSVTSSSQRESVISVASSAAGHGGGSSSSRTSIASEGAKSPPAAKSSPLPPPSPKRDSTSSGRPSISMSRLGAPDQPQLTRLSISPIPLSDIEDDDDGDLVPPPVMPSPTLPRAASTSGINSSSSKSSSRGNSHPSHHHHQANESISSIDMRDLLGLETVPDEEEDEPLGGLPPPPRAIKLGLSFSSPSKFVRHHHQASLADPIDPHTIYTRTKPEDRPSASSQHKSSPSIGSFSLPSSSKYSPVTMLAPFVPSSSGSVAPASPPPLTSTHAYVFAPAGQNNLPPSISTTTQFSSSPVPNSPLLESSSPSLLLETTDDPDSDDPPARSSSSASASAVTSPTIKDMRLGFRAERTRSAGLKHVLNARSRSRSVAAERERMPEPDVGLPPVPPVPGGVKPYLDVDSEGSDEKRDSTASSMELGLTGDQMGKVLSGIVITRTTKTEVEVVGGQREMTLEELGPAPAPPVPTQPIPSSVTAKPKPQAPESPKRPVAFPPQKSTTTKKQEENLNPNPKSKTAREDPRSLSPDIATILSTTPRPALSKSTSSASRSQLTSRRSRVVSAASAGSSKSKSANGVGQPGMGKRRVSEGSTAHLNRAGTASRFSGGSLPLGRTKSLESRALRSAGGAHGGAQQAEVEEEEYDEALEKVLEGEGSEDGDSDSSLDLHTPLPHLMVRHGLLSPHSKLLPGAASRAGTPMDGRPGSMLSVASHASIMTKSGIIKDERDTPMRRTRHRDGKLLKGGLGLTTGLGWSDSEDEDAPSPLTRRLSALNLSRRSSASSIMTGASSSRPTTAQRHPLSRSFSSGALTEQQTRRSYTKSEFDEFDDEELEEVLEDSTLKETGEWAQRQRSRIPSGGSSILSRPPSKSMLPPTSWQHKTATSGISRSSHGTATSRTSTSSVGSGFSLEVTTADGNTTTTRTPSLSRIRTPSGGARGLGLRRDSTGSSGVGIGRPSAMKKNSRDDVSVTTPSSTASTLSIPMPATPKDADTDGEEGFSSSTTPVPGSKIRSLYNKEKSLPPLPLRSVPSLSRMEGMPPSATTTTTTTAIPGSKFAFPRARTFSSTSSVSSLSPTAMTTPTSPAVRPLQLPRHAAAARAGGDRPAVPVPSVLSSSASRGSLRTPSLGFAALSPTSPDSLPPSPLLPSSPDASTTGIARPKPRTGTGMVYRTASSKMRPPMAFSSSTSTLPSSSGPSVGSIGRAGGVGKPIAL